MAKGLYLQCDGQVMVDYGKRRGLLSRAQYRANGYRPAYDNLPPEPAGKPRTASTAPSPVLPASPDRSVRQGVAPGVATESRS